MNGLEETRKLALRFAFELAMWKNTEQNPSDRMEIACLASRLAFIATGTGSLGEILEEFTQMEDLPF